MSFGAAAVNQSPDPFLSIRGNLIEFGLDRFQAEDYMRARNELQTPEGMLVRYTLEKEIPALRKECESQERAQRAAAQTTVEGFEGRFEGLGRAYDAAVERAR